MDKFLINSFPKSGDAFIYNAISSMYTDSEVVIGAHSAANFLNQSSNKIVTVVRNPADSIGLYFYLKNDYLKDDSLEIDMYSDYYIRFYNAVLENKNNIVLVDFEEMKLDLDHIVAKILNKFNINISASITMSELEPKLLDFDENYNLPMLNSIAVEEAKTKVINSAKYQECVDIYNLVKDLI
jgi:hypothetical protein